LKFWYGLGMRIWYGSGMRIWYGSGMPDPYIFLRMADCYTTARSPVRAKCVSSLTDSPWMPSFSMVRPRRQ